MTRLRALVLEDEWPARNYLVELIEATQLAEVVGAVATTGETEEAGRRGRRRPLRDVACDQAFGRTSWARAVKRRRRAKIIATKPATAATATSW